MYSQFIMICSPTFILPTLPTLPNYPYTLYPYNGLLEPTAYPSPQNENPSSEEYRLVKEEEATSRQSAETPVKPQSRFKYAKKNVQSNVVNQIFSYLTTRCKSYPILLRVLQNEEKIDAFYQIMRQAKKKNTKYMGRSVLESMLQLDDSHPVYILHKKLRFKVALKITEVRHALRVLTTYFLKNLVVPTILTSTKMDRTTIRQHLSRAREIQRYLAHTASPYF